MGNPNNRSAVFLDADGVLWKDVGAGGIISGKSQAIVNLEKIPVILRQKYLHFVITNQTLAARGEINYFRFRFIVRRMFKSLKKQKLIDDYGVCYHHPHSKKFYLKKRCSCRKPATGLIDQMVIRYGIDCRKSFLIGDRITDIACGQNAKIKNLLLLNNKRMLELNINSLPLPAQIVFTPLNSLSEFYGALGNIDGN